MTQDDDDESGANGGGLYQHKADLDMEWKTQSLPSLGRVSTEQSMESSGDEFAALRRTAPTRMIKSRNVSNNKYRECVSTGAAGAGTRRSLGHHLLHPLILRILVLCALWQYGLWSFQTGGTKLERFLPQNQHTQRKLLNFENWVSGEVSKIGHHFSK